jgi:hypothetical protein
MVLMILGCRFFTEWVMGQAHVKSETPSVHVPLCMQVPGAQYTTLLRLFG